MSTLETHEREVYEAMWGFEQYAEKSPGARYVDVFMEMADIEPNFWPEISILDAGAGSGKGAIELRKRGFAVKLCDITPNGLVPEAMDFPFAAVCLWHPLRPQLGYLGLGQAVEYVYCCDVMEHIPTPMSMLVVQNMLDVCRSGVFLSIALHPDGFGALIGETLHRTVEGFVWWRDLLRELGNVKECRDLGMTGLYFVEPR